ncbi:transposase, partial [Sutcliffiella horikoshii]
GCSIKSGHTYWRHDLIIINNKKDVLIMAKYKSYSPEFKEFVVKQIELDGHKIVDVSQNLDIPYDTLQKWLKKYRDQKKAEEKNAQNQLLTATEYREMFEAERKSKLELEEELTILKKAMHIFTQEKK